MKAACAFALFLISAMPAAAQRSGPDGTLWTDIHDDEGRLGTAENTLRKSTWGAGYLGLKILEEGGLDCGTTRENTLAFLDAVNAGEASVSFATPLTGLHGEYFTDGSIIVSAEGSAEDDRITITHEAQHWAGFGEPVETLEELNKLENVIRVAAAECITFVKEDEDDDEPGEGGGNTPTTETCTETQEWVPPVTKEVFVKPGSTQLEQGPAADTEHEPTYHLGTITVNVNSGKWVEVEIEEGYWKTVKTCTEN